MDELVWTGIENSTVGSEDNDATFNSTVAMSTSRKSAANQMQSVSAMVVVAFGLVITGIGIVTNFLGTVMAKTLPGKSRVSKMTYSVSSHKKLNPVSRHQLRSSGRPGACTSSVRKQRAHSDHQPVCHGPLHRRVSGMHSRPHGCTWLSL